MKHREVLQRILSAQLGPDYPTASFTPDRRLLGAIPELDSMAVVGILTAIEEQLGMAIDDDDISADVFQTFGALESFVRARV